MIFSHYNKNEINFISKSFKGTTKINERSQKTIKEIELELKKLEETDSSSSYDIQCVGSTDGKRKKRAIPAKQKLMIGKALLNSII